jgi:hypothetical protein
MGQYDTMRDAVETFELIGLAKPLSSILVPLNKAKKRWIGRVGNSLEAAPK